jgi:hypothetical protein
VDVADATVFGEDLWQGSTSRQAAQPGFQ